MNRVLLLAVLCVVAAAMVPRDRRAVDTEEAEIQPSTSKPICAAATPCGWAFYKVHNTLIESHVVNEYCECGVNTTCQVAEDDTNGQSFIKRCQLPSIEPEGESSTSTTSERS